MLLICPSCAKQYSVVEESIPSAGRIVKCASCDHSWLAGPWNGSGDEPSYDYEVAHPRSHSRTLPSLSQMSERLQPTALNSPRGSTALATLYDYEDQRFGEPLAAQSTALHEEEFISLDDRIEQATGHETIARLIQQQKALEESAVPADSSPFRDEISSLIEQVEASDADRLQSISVEYTIQDEAPAVSSQSLPTVDDVTIVKGPSLLSICETILTQGVERFNQLGDKIDAALPRSLFQRKKVERSDFTPGDAEALHWRERQRAKARNKLTPVKATAWLLLFAACLAVPALMRANQDVIMTAWPQSERLYALFGYGPQLEPVEIQNIEFRYAYSDKGEVIEIAGLLKNTGSDTTSTPLIKAEAFDIGGNLLTSWVFKVSGAPQLQAHMEVPFIVRTLAPQKISNLELSVLTAEEKQALDLSRSSPIVLDQTQGEGEKVFLMQRTTSSWGSGLQEQGTEE